MKYQYFNQCDRWRTRFDKGEEHWQEMMANKKPVAIGKFKGLVDFDGLLDPDDENDTIEEFIQSDPDAGFYSSKIGGTSVLFFQTAGFEFIFTKDGKEPSPSPNMENDTGLSM